MQVSYAGVCILLKLLLRDSSKGAKPPRDPVRRLGAPNPSEESIGIGWGGSSPPPKKHRSEKKKKNTGAILAQAIWIQETSDPTHIFFSSRPDCLVPCAAFARASGDYGSGITLLLHFSARAAATRRCSRILLTRNQLRPKRP